MEADVMRKAIESTPSIRSCLILLFYTGSKPDSAPLLPLRSAFQSPTYGQVCNPVALLVESGIEVDVVSCDYRRETIVFKGQ